MPLDDVLTPQEASAESGLSVRTIQAYCKSGAIKAKYRGGVWWIEPAALREYQENKRERGRPAKEDS